MTTTNKYGSMLRELLDKRTPQARQEEIFRKFDEFSDREEKYKSWLRSQDGKFNPAFLDLPLSLIYSNILAQDLADIVIQLPSGYKHLLIFGSGRTTGAGASAQYVLGQFNDDTGANYNQEKLQVSTTTVSGIFDASQSGAITGILVEGGGVANSAGSFFTVIPHYLSSFYKSVLMLGFYNGNVRFVGTRWASTSKIETLRLVPITDSFAAGSVFSVFGVR